MTTETFLPASHDGIKAWSQASGEPAWLTELRLNALELAGTLEWPKLEKMKLERWNLESFGQYKSASRLNRAEELPASVQDYLQADNLLVQRNAGIAYLQLSEELAKQGVIFTDLQTAATQHPELVQRHLLSIIDKGENKVTALHAAMWSGGVFLYIPKNVVVDQPLQAVFLTDEDDVQFSPHVLIVAEANSKVNYVENVVCSGRTRSLVHNGMTEVLVKQGAEVHVASVHNLQQETTDLTYRRAVVENDARVQWMVGEMNYGDTMSDTVSVLKGNGSLSDAKVICVGTGDQKLNLTTRAQHIGRNSSSDMLTRAVMRDTSTGIFNGITKIEKGATDSNGQQTERVLMMNPKARGDANPMLLIDEDEVKAGHAASVGQVNKDQVYYLMSRGISREDATNLIIYGFLAPIVSEIPIKSVEKQLSGLVDRKLGRA